MNKIMPFSPLHGITQLFNHYNKQLKSCIFSFVPISPQYIIFCYMSYIIMEAWLSHDPNIIGVQFLLNEYQPHEWSGCPFCKVPISISAGIGNITRCTAQSAVPSSLLSSHSFSGFSYLTLIINGQHHEYITIIVIYSCQHAIQT